MTQLVDSARLGSIDPHELVAAGIGGFLAYTGEGCPSVEWLREAVELGLRGAFVFEAGEDWTLGGFNAGRTAAFAADHRLDTLGDPFMHATVYYVANDGTPGIGDTAAVRTECFRGILDATSRELVGAYGSRSGLDAARAAGARVAHLWGVETWGQPDWSGYPLDLMQLANTASPVADTDLNDVFATVWGQVPKLIPPAPPAHNPEVAEMIVLLCDGQLPLLVAPTWCDEVESAGSIPSGSVTADQRAYIINAIRAQYPPEG